MVGRYVDFYDKRPTDWIAIFVWLGYVILKDLSLISIL